MPSLVLNAGGSEEEESKKYNFVLTAIINIFLHGLICPLSTGNVVCTALSIEMTVYTEFFFSLMPFQPLMPTPSFAHHLQLRIQSGSESFFCFFF